MEAAGTFDRLVSELSLGERRELFKKLESQAIVSAAPLFRLEELPESVILEHRFRESSFLLRLYLRILSVFKQKSPLRLFEDRLISRLGAAVEARAPGIFSHRQNLLSHKMYRELLSLKESARFFYEALDGSVVRDKGAFFAFLASLEMDTLHRRLLTETDPYVYASTNSQAAEADIRQAIHKSLESILESIDEEQRAVMYRNVRSLLCLKELAAFLFDRMLSAFSGPDDEKSCPAYLLLDQLMVLSDILFSLDSPPSLSLLESLFVFDLHDQLGGERFDLDDELRKLVSRAEGALSKIRDFNRNVPLTSILRCGARNLSYLPSAVTGGEDWFATYREFWKKRIEDRFTAFVKDRRREQLEQSLGSFFGGRQLPRLDSYASVSAEGLNARGMFTLSYLFGFYRHVFLTDVNRPLKLLLLEGEFYKKDNRIEYTDAYNELLKLGDNIQALDAKAAPDGDFGKRLELAKKEMIALPLKRRKLSSLQQELDSEALAIIERAVRALRSLSSVLGGVLHGEVGGRYDTLSNMGTLSGRGGSTFISSLRNALQKIEKTIQMLGEIDSVESGR